MGVYELLGELGRGGAGSVYRARAPGGREVALKLLHPTAGARSEGAGARFAREGRLQAALGASLGRVSGRQPAGGSPALGRAPAPTDASGFVPCLDVGEAPEGPFLVMPLLPGGTLRARLEGGPLSVDEALDLTIAVARAVGRAHAAGVVHRDLKPENILFDAEGRPLVADLGLAKFFADDAPGAGGSLVGSRTGELRGTVGYMAPEQVRDAKSVGPPADVFALGAIAYECLAGRPAFSGDSLVAVLAAVLACDPTPLQALRPEVPAPIAAALGAALAATPEDRPADGEALARQLEVARGRGAPARARRRPGLATVALSATLASAAVAGALWALGAGVGGAAPPTPTAVGATDRSAPSGGAAGPADGPRGPAARLAALRLEATFGDRRGRHGAPVLALHVTADDRLVTACEDGALRLWSQDGAALVLRGPEPWPLEALALGPAAAWALVGTRDGRILRWPLRPDAEPTLLTRLGAPARALVVGRTGEHALVGAGSVLSWLTLGATGTQVRSSDLGRPVAAVAFVDRATSLVAVGGATSLSLHRLAARAPERVRTLVGASAKVTSLSRSYDPNELAVGHADGRVSVWRLPDGELARSFLTHAAAVTAVGRAPEGQVLTGSEEGALAMWSESTHLALEQGHGGAVTGVAALSDGRLASAGVDGFVRLWALAPPDQLRPLWGEPGHGARVAGVGLDAAGDVVSAGADGKLLVWSAATGEVKSRLGCQPPPLLALSVSSDGRLALTAGRDGPPRVWDLVEPTLERLLVDHRGGEMAAVALPPGGALAVTASTHPALVVWDLGTGEVRAALAGPEALPEGPAIALAPLADGERLWALFRDGALVMFSLSDLRRLSRLRAPEAVGLAIRERGRSALTAGGDGLLLSWDLARSRGDPARGAVVRAGGPLVAVAALDEARALACEGRGDLSLWDLDAGRRLGRLDLREAGLGGPTCVVVAPDGRAAFAGTEGGFVVRVGLNEGR